MNLTTWHYIGIILFLTDIAWIVVYYYYATVKVYNLCERAMYQYLGYLWIRKRRGQYYLKIPKEMIDNSLTTQYKIISQSRFHILKKGEWLHIEFANGYCKKVKIDKKIIVQNYIATARYL